MKIVSSSDDRSRIIVETRKGLGFIANINTKIRYQEKLLPSLRVMGDFYGPLMENLPSIEEILKYKLVGGLNAEAT